MDYKKKYEDALERCKKAFNFNNLAYSHEEIRERLEHVFPELKKSEDKRIREELIRDIDIAMPFETAQRYIAWLEKQGEQKVNEIHPIFRVGDYIRNKKTSDEVLIEQLDVKAKDYYYTSYDGGAEIHSDFPFSKQDEWELIGQKSVEHKPTWSEEDEEMVNNIVDYMRPMPIFFESTIGESGKKYTQKFIEDAIVWLKSIKERME